jgi:hypothetical protein
MHARPWTAVVAVLFAVATVAAYGSGTGFGTTASSGADELMPAHDTAAAIRRVQTPEQEPAATQAPPASQTPAAAVPQAPADDPAPAQHVSSRARQADSSGDDEDDDADDGHGKGHGLGNTYCQSLKAKGGPAFGHCIAAKAHELHQHGKHR